MLKSAPIVNQELSNLFLKELNPTESFSKDQGSALFLRLTANHDLTKGRLVLLECGHFIITKALNKAKCLRCGEMIRSGYDYDAFRNLGQKDDFSWPDDPLQYLHEETVDLNIHRKSII